MSIFAYVGFPGAGKSYVAVEQQILPALKAGRTVVTNIAMRWDLVRKDFPGNLLEFPTELVVSNPEEILNACPNGAVVVLDELWKLFPAGVKTDKVPDAYKTLLAEHRHRVDAAGNSMQIVYVCQDLAQIAAFARQLVEQTFRTTKLTSVGFSKRYRTDVFPGPVTGPNPPISTRLREIFGTYDKKVYGYYISHTQSEAGQAGANEAAIDKRGNVLMRPLLLLSPVIIIALVWFGLHVLNKSNAKLHATSVSGAPGGRPDQPRTATRTPDSPTQYRATQQAASQQDTYRVIGVVLNNARPALSVAMLQRNNEKGFIERPFEDCRVLVGSGFECLLAGVWYADTGSVRPDESGVVLDAPAANSVPYAARVFGMDVPAAKEQPHLVVEQDERIPSRYLAMSADELRKEISSARAQTLRN